MAYSESRSMSLGRGRTVERAKRGKSSSSAPFWQRLLFPERNTQTPVPPLLSQPEYSEACDEYLYALVGLICREHVLTWYSKLTRDKSFVADVGSTLIQVIKNLESCISVTAACAPVLLGSDVPRLLESHISDFHLARKRHHVTRQQHQLGNEQEDFATSFHRLRPHFAFDPARQPGSKLPFVSPAYLSALVDGLLQELLPPSDYQSPAERTVIREVLLYVVLSNFFTRLAKPWFIHALIVKMLTSQPGASPSPQPPKAHDASSKTPAEWFQCVRTRITAVCNWLSSLYASECMVNEGDGKTPDLVWPTFKLLCAMVQSSERSVMGHIMWVAALILTFIQRSANMFMLGTLGPRRLMPPERLASVLQMAQGTLFPGGHPAPSVPDPSPDEQAELRDAARKALSAAVPGNIPGWLFAGPPGSEDETLVEGLLAPFDCWSANALLILCLLECIVARLFPSLALQKQ